MSHLSRLIRRFSKHRAPRYISGLMILIVLSFSLTSCVPAKPIVYVYGDSLTWESQDYINFLANTKFDTRVISMGGTAVCDYSNSIVSDAERDRPAMVVLAFTGNAMTQCMNGFSTETAIATKYIRDLTAIAERLKAVSVPLALVTPPPGLKRENSIATTSGIDAQAVLNSSDSAQFGTQSESGYRIGQLPPGYSSHTGLLVKTYRDWVDSFRLRGYDVGIVDGTTPFMTPSGAWTKVQPCLPYETAAVGCTNGTIDVRGGDMTHFCPEVSSSNNGVVVGCSKWSSGSWRYAAAITGYIDWRLTNRATGNLDLVATTGRGIEVTGWAFDPDGDRSSTQVHIYATGLSGSVAGRVLAFALDANLNRDDVASAFPLAPKRSGFSGAQNLTPGRWRICGYVINIWGTDRGQNHQFGCRDVTVPDWSPIGFIDLVQPSAGNIRIAGWTGDFDAPEKPVVIQISVDSAIVATLNSDLRRTDAARAFPPLGPSRGFDTTVTTTKGAHQVCVTAINIGSGSGNTRLGCANVTVP